MNFWFAYGWGLAVGIFLTWFIYIRHLPKERNDHYKEYRNYLIEYRNLLREKKIIMDGHTVNPQTGELFHGMMVGKIENGIWHEE